MARVFTSGGARNSSSSLSPMDAVMFSLVSSNLSLAADHEKLVFVLYVGSHVNTVCATMMERSDTSKSLLILVLTL